MWEWKKLFALQLQASQPKCLATLFPWLPA